MKLFDVYPLYEVTPVRAKDVYVYDAEGTEYLDLYGGHAVISIGHGHQHYVKRIKEQLDQIGFYSNAIQNPLQQQLADAIGHQSCCHDYQLFLCSSGAEAIENALKLASFHTNKKRIIAFKNAFHGRTSAAVAATDNSKINAPLNQQQAVTFLAFNDTAALENKARDKCGASKAAAGVRVYVWVRPTAAGGVQLDLRPVLSKRSLYLVSKSRTNPVPKRRLVGWGHSISSVKERLEESWSSWWTSRRISRTDLAQSAPLYRPSQWTSVPAPTRASF